MESDFYFVVPLLRYFRISRTIGLVFPGVCFSQSTILRPDFDSSRKTPGGFFFRFGFEEKMKKLWTKNWIWGPIWLGFSCDVQPYDFKIDRGNRFLSTIPRWVFFPIVEKNSRSRDICIFVWPSSKRGGFFPRGYESPHPACAQGATHPHTLCNGAQHPNSSWVGRISAAAHLEGEAAANSSAVSALRQLPIHHHPMTAPFLPGNEA